MRGLRGRFARVRRDVSLRRARDVWQSFTAASHSACPPTIASIRSRSSSSWPTRWATGRSSPRRRIARWLAIDANLATPCVRNPRDLLLCSLAAPLPRGRGAECGARAGRTPARRRGVRDVPQRRTAPDRTRARRPALAGVPRRAPGRARARLGARHLRRAHGRARRARRHDRIESAHQSSCSRGRAWSHSLSGLWASRDATTPCLRAPTSCSRPSGSSGIAPRPSVSSAASSSGASSAARGVRARVRSAGRGAPRTARLPPRTASRRRSWT